MKYDVLIIGGGVNGLAVAYHLSHIKKLKVLLLEQFTLGNPFGGSHGFSRIIRGTYANPIYIQWMKRVYQYEWPLLEKEAGRRLIHPNPGCFFGTGKLFEKYLQAIENSGFDIQRLSVSDARRLFPQFTFANCSAVLSDRTGGVIAAAEVLQNLAHIARKNGVEIRENTKVVNIDADKNSLQVMTDEETFSTNRLVVATGAYLPQLFPQFRSHLTAIRQTVGYFILQGDPKSFQIGNFPNWSYLGEQVFYGLPEFGSKGIKVAQHRTSGKTDDPNQHISQGDPAEIKILEHFVKEQFVQPIQKLVSSETCFYANTPTEDFILECLPSDPRVVIGSACSGHAFKFAPLTGRILAELALHGKTTIPEFEEYKQIFLTPLH